MGVAIGPKDDFAHWILLGAILIVATLLRVVAIDTQSLWTDEALTIVLANWSIGDMFLKPTDPTPFLYYAIHKLLVPPDASLAGMRSISVVAGVLSVGLIYILGRLAFGKWGGLLSAALLAIWSMHVDYSQEARAYSLLFFFTLLASVGFLYYAEALKAGREPSGRGRLALVLFGIGNVLSFYTHVVSVYWIALTSLMLLALILRQKRKRLVEVGILFVVMALCALPGVYRLLVQMKVGDEFHWLQRSLAGFLKLHLEVYLPRGFWDNTLVNTFGLTSSIKGVVVAGAVAAVGAGLWFGRQRILAWWRERPYVLWLALAYLLVPTIIWIHGLIARPILIGRVMLYTVPGMILLITGICLALDRRAAVRVGVAAISLYGVSLLLTGTIREREDWRGTYEYLAKTVAPGDLVAVCRPFIYPALRYPATAPLLVPLVTEMEGRLAEIAPNFGSDPDWDRIYFRKFVLPQTTARIEGRHLSTADLGPSQTITLAPGRSIWRVDSHCRKYAADMDGALRAIDAGAGVTRFESQVSQAAIVSVRQYRILETTTFEIQKTIAQ
jgi:hypothetical protein